MKKITGRQHSSEVTAWQQAGRPGMERIWCVMSGMMDGWARNDGWMG